MPMWFEGLFTPDLFNAMIRIATPLALAAIGGTFCERSGVINIALEGLMLTGAFAGVVVSYLTGNPWLGILGAALVAGILSLAHAFASVHLMANQVVVGTAINFFALGATGFMTEYIFKQPGATPSVPGLSPVKIPFLGDIPWIGHIFFNHTPIVYMTFLIVILGHFVLFKTTLGLRIRAVGEHPRASDTVGISVAKMRYLAVFISGLLGGLAGANLSVENVKLFSEGMSAGRGFIALAANIFGKWTPIGSWVASLVFGFAGSLELRVQLLKVPPEFLLMLPYVLTIIVLAGAMGRAIPPAAIGKPYRKDSD